MSFAQQLRNAAANETIENIKYVLMEAAKHNEVELTILFNDPSVKDFTAANFSCVGQIGKLLNILYKWTEKEGVFLSPEYQDNDNRVVQIGWKFSWDVDV